MTNESILKQQILEDMQTAINEIIAGDRADYSTTFLCPDDIVSYFEKLGAVKEDWDSNGWQWDFWFYMMLDGREYRVSGSGYYGGITVRETKDEEE